MVVQNDLGDDDDILPDTFRYCLDVSLSIIFTPCFFVVCSDQQWISEQQAELDSRLSAATAQYRVTNQGQTGAGQGGQVGHFVNQSSIHVQSAPTQAPRCPVSGSVSLSHSRSVSLHLFPLPTRTVFYLLH